MKAHTIELGRYSVASLPKGEFVTFKTGGPVWIRGEYDRASKRYSMTKFDDCNHERFVKGTVIVDAGFSF